MLVSVLAFAVFLFQNVFVRTPFSNLSHLVMKNGFGFVEFDDVRDAEDAVHDLNGRDLCGERVVVELSRRGPRGGGGYGGDRGGRGGPPQYNRSVFEEGYRCVNDMFSAATGHRCRPAIDSSWRTSRRAAPGRWVFLFDTLLR